MDNILCSNLYKEFREALLSSAAGLDEMNQLISTAVVPVAETLNIGKIEGKVMAPSSPMQRNGFSNEKVFFESNEGFETNALIENFRTSDNGIATLAVHPKLGHKFSEDEIRATKLLATDLFVLVDRSKLISQVKRASLTDTMTGIPNIASLNRHGMELKLARQLGNYTAIFLNLKNYKYINKAFTPAAADQGLISYAKALVDFTKNDEYAVRLGGDNFFALIQNENLGNFISTFSSYNVVLKQGIDQVRFHIQSRMGIYPIRETDSINEALHCASITMTVAKNETGNDIVFFSPKILQKVLHEKEISSVFQEAYRNNEFMVYYQPKIHLDGNRLQGCEALVRWKRNDNIVSPADFLPVLEKEASICQLDLYVFETVCRDIRSWLDRNIEPVRVSSNFSKLHLRNPNLAQDIFDIMEKYNIESKYIEIELTEVSDFEDNQAMQKFVSQLRARDISVSIDDFGTGYSTLNVLKDYDVNIIKLDKSLLDHIGEDKLQDKVVLKNMVSMMNELNKEVIAEGVENEIQINFLKDINCAMVQGFIYDKPMPRHEFEERLMYKRAYN
ncbi:putative bifunctional diguanylate cyclase/phosphodiesterase [Fibrobacter sp.]|uniref:putative bifunctional diguanylate cyclase/phosphodiesterase n=1 Tax=Fibrobacter sp. TaxID=35828 RepID=UPI00388DEAC0